MVVATVVVPVVGSALSIANVVLTVVASVKIRRLTYLLGSNFVGSLPEEDELAPESLSDTRE